MFYTHLPVSLIHNSLRDMQVKTFGINNFVLNDRVIASLFLVVGEVVQTANNLWFKIHIK